MTSEPKYEDYANMIRKIAWDRVKKNRNLDFEDIMAEGNLTFVEASKTWNPEKGKFSTHLYWQLRHKYGMANGRNIDDSNHLVDIENIGERSGGPTPWNWQWFKESLEGLGAEAFEVVSMIYNSPAELCDFTAKTVVQPTKKSIRKFLTGKKWEPEKIDTVFNEISEMLKTVS